MFRLLKRIFLFGILAWALLFALAIVRVKHAQRNIPPTQTSKDSATKHRKAMPTPRQDPSNTLFMR